MSSGGRCVKTGINNCDSLLASPNAAEKIKLDIISNLLLLTKVGLFKLRLIVGNNKILELEVTYHFPQRQAVFSSEDHYYPYKRANPKNI